MAEHNDLGKWGEDLAADYLQRKGYMILERDWKSGHRDLVVFVEVKTRRNRIFGDPVDAVGYQKIRNLQQAANHYVKYRCINRDIRFDIVCITGTADSETDIEHIEDAF